MKGPEPVRGNEQVIPAVYRGEHPGGVGVKGAEEHQGPGFHPVLPAADGHGHLPLQHVEQLVIDMGVAGMVQGLLAVTDLKGHASASLSG